MIDLPSYVESEMDQALEVWERDVAAFWSREGRIKRFRRYLGLSQRRFAKAAGVAWISVLRWERGSIMSTRQAMKLERLARARLLGAT